MGPMMLTSRDNDRVRRVCRLLDDADARAEAGQFAAESTKLCLDIAAVLPPREVYYTQAALEKEPRLASLPGGHYLLADHVAEKLSRTRSTQGVWAVFDLPVTTLAQMTGRRILALDAVQDPGNVGAVLRSAAAFGWQGALLGAGCADPFGSKALRAGMSSTVKLPLLRTDDLPGTLRQMRERGYRCMAARLEDSEELPALPQEMPCVLVVGSEGQGICPAVATACDVSVRIPIAPAMESLNAAAAAAVLMWHYR